ncbi:MAG: winged helix-turn-helix domain-containing protein, partial [Ilumatobacteraceae bacterium]
NVAALQMRLVDVLEDSCHDRKAASAALDALLATSPEHLPALEMLVRHAGKLVTYEQLLHEVWGPTYEKETNYLRVFMTQIRQKLEPEPSQPRYFLTEPGIGFRFDLPEPADPGEEGDDV